MGKSAPKPQDAKPQSTRGPARPGSSAPAAAASAATSSSGSGGGGIRDRSKCVLLKRDGDDVKTATYICGGCGAQLTGFTAWRNHLKKSTRFKKCASAPSQMDWRFRAGVGTPVLTRQPVPPRAQSKSSVPRCTASAVSPCAPPTSQTSEIMTVRSSVLSLHLRRLSTTRSRRIAAGDHDLRRGPARISPALTVAARRASRRARPAGGLLDCAREAARLSFADGCAAPASARAAPLCVPCRVARRWRVRWTGA
jgi:hypothetical protein